VGRTAHPSPLSAGPTWILPIYQLSREMIRDRQHELQDRSYMFRVADHPPNASTQERLSGLIDAFDGLKPTRAPPMQVKRRNADFSRCQVVCKSGNPCTAPAKRGSRFCALHGDPKHAAEIGRKGGKSNRHVTRLATFLFLVLPPR
jgi:hypothetical protein